ncbi:MAG: hypothetical protein M3522_08180, partial [Actinomycetota bacterium]|nr:hypothetical protein [Actinomycetota bacterium]
ASPFDWAIIRVMIVLGTLWFFLWRMTLRGLLFGALLGSLYGGMGGLIGALVSSPGVLEAAGNVLTLALIGGFVGAYLGVFLGPGCGLILCVLTLLWTRIFPQKVALYRTASALSCAVEPFVMVALFLGWQGGSIFGEPSGLTILLPASLAAAWSAWRLAGRFSER